MRFLALAVVALLAGCSSGPVRDLQADGDGFVPMFNGKDLSSWVNVNGGPETWSVQDGVIITSGKPSGILRSPKMYENFVLELEWSHQREGGNSGLFVHSGALPIRGNCFTKAHEIQIMLGDDPKGLYSRHGDMFSIQGATFVPDRPHPGGWMRCLPSEKRVKGAGEWNHYRVISKDGTLKLEANGKEVSGGTQCKPRKGYICLESEGSPCHFKNVRIKELPSSNPAPEEVAEADAGFVNLYGGDFRGWKTDAKDDWKAKDFAFEGKGGVLWTEKEFGDFSLICDWKTPKTGSAELRLRGTLSVKLETSTKPGQWNRARLKVKGNGYALGIDDGPTTEQEKAGLFPPKGPLGLVPGGDATTFTNIYFKELK
jgi:3-keto-disaccharide hydrolase